MFVHLKNCLWLHILIIIGFLLLVIQLWYYTYYNTDRFCIHYFRCICKIAKSEHQRSQACLSDLMKQIGSHWTDLHTIYQHFQKSVKKFKFNPLNAKLNPICHLLALLGGATIVVVSRLRVKGHEHTCIHASNRIRSRYSSVRGEQDSKLLTADGKAFANI